jgi:hypothetical protein
VHLRVPATSTAAAPAADAPPDRVAGPAGEADGEVPGGQVAGGPGR